MLYGGILFRFKVEKGNLFHVIGNEKLKLDVHSGTEFTSGSRRYRFLLADDGKPKGVQILDPHYDPQTSENSVIFLSLNDAPADGKGLNKPEWSKHVGRYTGTFIGDRIETNVALRNGYLYLDGVLKLTEVKPGFFITADGDSVVFTSERLSVGNKVYFKSK